MSAPRVLHIATVDLTVRFLLLPQLLALKEAGYDVAAAAAPGPWVQEIEDRGIRFLPWHHASRSWSLRRDGRAWAELIRLIRRERPDVLHTHSPKPGVMGRLAGHRAGAHGVLNTVHGYYATPDDPLLRRILVMGVEAAAACFSDVELFQSREDLAWARRRRIVPRDQGIWIGNGVDVDFFSPGAVMEETCIRLRHELNLPPGPVVGMVGRLVEEKGIRELVEAARAVRTRVPGCSFVIVGGDEPDKSDAIRASEIANEVVVTGWRSDVRDLLALMDVFVLPSWREGLPRSAIEAAAMARPLVLTDIRGCREVATPNVEALFVPKKDPRALAHAISYLLDDPEVRARMGAAARRRAETAHDERRVAAAVVGQTEKILTMKGRPTPPVRAQPAIRTARTQDVPAIVRHHTRALPNAFLPRLGLGFLSALYEALLRDPSGVVLVAASESGAVHGFVAGTPSLGAFYRRFLRRHGVTAAARAAGRLVRPSNLRAALETLDLGRSPAARRAELMAIAVDPSVRGSGVGRALVEGLMTSLCHDGVRSVAVTVESANRGAVDFYRALGFSPVATTEVHRGTSSEILVRSCDHDQPNEDPSRS
ncbi:MAG: GNAT family N-acetyltransferase [Actinomycetota bacterium]